MLAFSFWFFFLKNINSFRLLLLAGWKAQRVLGLTLIPPILLHMTYLPSQQNVDSSWRGVCVKLGCVVMERILIWHFVDRRCSEHRISVGHPHRRDYNHRFSAPIFSQNGGEKGQILHKFATHFRTSSSQRLPFFMRNFLVFANALSIKHFSWGKGKGLF